MTKNKILLIDGNSVAYRAFFAMHAVLEKFKNKSDLHTNAIFAFNNMIENVVKKEKPTHALVAFDAGKTTFRTEFFADYKGGRAKTPGEFKEQIPYIKELTAALGLTHYELKNYEADDIIGTLAKLAAAENFEVIVVSGDKDLTQLASSQVTVQVTKKGVSELEPYTPATIAEKYDGLTPLQIIDLKGLAGDTSDNIPGVNGMGPKTAIKLLKQFGSVENIYQNLDQIKASKMKENIVRDEAQAKMSKQLATINQAAPVTISLADLSYSGANLDKLIPFYEEMDFQSLLSKVAPESVAPIVLTDLDYQVIDTVKPEYFAAENALYIEMLTSNYHTAEIIGLAFGHGDKIYVLDSLDLVNEPNFQDFLKNPQQKKLVFDAKATFVASHRLGVDPVGIDFDLLLASYLLNPNENANDLGTIAKNFDFVDIANDESVYGKGAKLALPEKNIWQKHLAHKISALLSVKDQVVEKLAEISQTQLFYEMELPLSLVLAQMEITGITVDRSRLEAMQGEFSIQLEAIEEKIYATAGEHFNLNSPKQLGVILFEKMQLPVIKKTKTGYSTAVDVLEQLRSQAPIVDDILTYRQIAKIQSTYVEGLLKVIAPDGKIHTRYQQTLTQTGRLSSVDPNLQNIPVRLEEGRKIRQAFVPRQKDWLLYSSDYSQIELRVLAHISGDEHLQQAFIEGQDIHNSTARRVFGLAEDAVVTPNMRRQAKAVNFGIVYGISDYGLSQNLGITRKQAQTYIDTYFEKYPGVKKYMEEVVREAKEAGFVETLYHRRRYLPEINSRNFNLRSFAERTAINTPIQGSAADILKIAMIDMQKALEKEKMSATMLLQVHDELVFEVPEEELEKLDALVKEVMENAVKLAIPLVTESNWGHTWYEAK
ncbi:DNA polymerase I [Enterococcus timonensis]|uniref:DNA polymerase I n=1 Tax=Enterococcus timonensis TaxID=1852364 RepID=UPI0008D8D792|nr:DNA polymerase I [Enterococcus timonensis]